MSRLLTVINRYADRPIYRQLSDLLEARLAEAAKPGDRLPSEAELSHEYDVNRLTVRRALSELNQRGLIETVHGKGSFVAPPSRVTSALTSLRPSELSLPVKTTTCPCSGRPTFTSGGWGDNGSGGAGTRPPRVLSKGETASR